jgi:FkbM family methyltransferase
MGQSIQKHANPSAVRARVLGDLRFAAAACWHVLRSGALFRGTAEWRRTWRKARWLALRHFGVEEIVLPFDGMQLTARTADHAVGCQVYIDGHFGRDEFRRALQLVADAGLFRRARPLFVDVGANIGTHTLYALKSGRFGRVISIEPEPGNFELLRRNRLLNGFAAADAYNVALSNVRGTGRLVLSARNFGDHRVLRDAHGMQAAATAEIELIDFGTLIQLARLDCEAATMFWIDTQGHEYEVLTGIPAALLRANPFVIEYWPAQLRRNGTLEALDGLLARVAKRFIVLQDGRQLQSAAEISALAAELMRDKFGRDQVDLLCLGCEF